MSAHPLEAWHRVAQARDAAALPALLAEDAVFHSPLVHAPQSGRAVVAAYLGAAFKVFGNTSFRYVRQVVGERDAALEFETSIDGIQVNGVDLIAWDEAGLIVDFKVMVRPFKAIQVVQQAMAEMLAAAQAKSP